MIAAADLQGALQDDRHFGWGYACTRKHGPAFCKKLDREVVDAANELELGYEELFAWANSKNGRWLDDQLDGTETQREVRETVRCYLDASAMNWLAEELGWERRWTQEEDSE